MSKGGSFENEIAKALSLWFTDKKRDDVFGRSDCSGGRFTQRRKKGQDTANQAGDLTFNDAIGEPLIKIWSIEVKTGYAPKNKVKDADGDVIKIPIYAKVKKGEETKKPEERVIIGWKDKTAVVLWDLLDLIDSRQTNPVLSMMWKQCVRDADESSRIPILIFRRNNRRPCICIRRSYYFSRDKYLGKINPDKIIFLNLNGDPVILMSLKTFFEWAQPPCGILSD